MRGHRVERLEVDVASGEQFTLPRKLEELARDRRRYLFRGRTWKELPLNDSPQGLVRRRAARLVLFREPGLRDPKRIPLDRVAVEPEPNPTYDLVVCVGDVMPGGAYPDCCI